MISFYEEFMRSWLTSLIGIFLFCAGVWVLARNEGRAVHHAHSLDEAYNNVISLNPNENLHGYNGHLIHISGPLIVEEPLTDPEYGISIESVKLKRRVQMYQWVEERMPRDDNNLGTGNADVADYYYVTEWRDKLVDSSSFYIRHGHQNPTEMPLTTHTSIARFVLVGRIELGDEIKQKFNDYVEVTSDERPENEDIKLHLGIYYHDDIWKPEVGNLRIQFYFAGMAGDPVTIIASLKNGILVPYFTSQGHEIALVRHGLLSVHEMFTSEHAEAKIETWKIRAFGMFLMYASSVCLARLLRIGFNKVPILRNTFSQDPTASSNFAISMSTSMFVIATAWIAYRPMLGAGLLLFAMSPFLYCTLSLFNTIYVQNSYYNR